MRHFYHHLFFIVFYNVLRYGKSKFFMYNLDYILIMIFIVIGAGMAIAMYLLSKILSPSSPDSEKLSAYECGFEAFDDTRSKFDVKFYLVSILFIIFDLEIAFLFPWAVSLGNIGALGFYSMMFFLFILTVGFIYEWRNGALDWE